jgi:hypothetical protein
MKRINGVKGRKYIAIKAFTELNEVEKAIVSYAKTNNTQLALLIKLGQTLNTNAPLELEKIDELKAYWNKVMGSTAESGFFQNLEIGTVFVWGALSGIFLHNVNGKKLGAMTAGPYGILRGLGIEERLTTDYIKKLNKGHYLLLTRTN